MRNVKLSSMNLHSRAYSMSEMEGREAFQFARSQVLNRIKKKSVILDHTCLGEIFSE
jgi:hypothetical protein